MKCILVVGHKHDSQGAYNNVSGVTEYRFNNELAKHILRSNHLGVDIEVVYRETYHALPSKINALNSDFIISLHCNAYNDQTSGTEVLYYDKTKVSDVLATKLQKNLVATLGLKNRGIKPRGKKSRGYRLLKNTNSPCVISEPFFIDNISDLSRALSRYDDLVNAYTKTILQYASYLQKRRAAFNPTYKINNISLENKLSDLEIYNALVSGFSATNKLTGDVVYFDSNNKLIIGSNDGPKDVGLFSSNHWFINK